MKKQKSFRDLLNSLEDTLSPAEQRVAHYFAANRHQALVATAQEIAELAKTSDATVVRTAKSLGFKGLDELRRSLAAEMTTGTSIANRVARTMENSGSNLVDIFRNSLDAHRKSISDLRQSFRVDLFEQAITQILAARRVAIFGIGPSGAIADYFFTHLRRFGLDASVLSQTGTLLADELLQVKKDDCVIFLSYGRVSPEMNAALNRIENIGAHAILITDDLKPALQDRIALILEVPRGRLDSFSTHSTTLAFLETLLVGIAAQSPDMVLNNLDALNEIRVGLLD